MYFQLTRDEIRLLERLLQSRIEEIHPEIRRSMDHRYKHQLRDELEQLERLLHRVHEADCDVTA